VKIEVLNAKNEPQVFDVKRYAAKSEMSEAVGNFPAQPVIFEAKRLDGNIGYIRFNMWIIPQMAKIRRAVKEFSDAKGIVFDLRGNPGGVGGMAPGVAGLLTAEKTSLGSMTSRASEQKFIVYPQPDPFKGKVVVLTDYGSASTSEVFAAGMQEAGLAKIVGERTAGAVLPSVFTVLPTGAIFQYVISDYKSPKSVLIEKRGVAPDTEVKQTRAALLQGRDLPLEEAVRQILQ
jgi:carboxyl-terminal processing protease